MADHIFLIQFIPTHFEALKFYTNTGEWTCDKIVSWQNSITCVSNYVPCLRKNRWTCSLCVELGIVSNYYVLFVINTSYNLQVHKIYRRRKNWNLNYFLWIFLSHTSSSLETFKWHQWQIWDMHLCIYISGNDNNSVVNVWLELPLLVCMKL